MKTKLRYCPYCGGISRRAGYGLFECRSCRKRFRKDTRPPTQLSEHHRYVSEFHDRGIHNPFEAMELAMKGPR